ncbi:MAG TPA: gamma-glutamyl-gamma-aminobutyrate hydrolase family protein [Clostridia bacterium]|nr:gamma-glutamyl-gamma-aminobutyrate hydrolase family protein [Clostridia bacterium]
MAARRSSPKPFILVTADTVRTGAEATDCASQLAEAYQHALMRVGGIPVTLPATTSREVIAECVRRCDGVLLTGGDDVAPEVYGPALRPALRAKVNVTPDGGQRDFREVQLIDQVFRQRKPLLAICRGQQVLNVALGGTLVADLSTLRPGPIEHRRMEAKREVVHDVHLTEHSLLAKIVGGRNLGVNSTHHQAVDRVAPLLQVVATSPDGVIEGLELKRLAGRYLPFLLAVQFHPERLVDRYPEHQAIFGAFAEACVLGQEKYL